KFADGVYMNEIPLWFVVLAAGGGCIWFAERRGQRRLSGRVGDTETIEAQPAATSTFAADGQPTSAPTSPVAGALAAFSGLDSKTKSLLFIGIAVVVLVGGGIKITQSAQAAWNYKLEGDYAQREAEGIAQMEADERAAQEALEAEVDSGGGSGGGDYTSADYSQAEEDDSSGEGTTPNGHSRWMQLPDIISMAPEDGSVQHTFVTYTAAGGDGSSFILEIDDISLGGSDPAYIHDVQLFGEDFGSCYVNDQPVSADEFLEFAMDNWGALGSIEFNQDAIVRANSYSEDYVPADGY
ncbi:MAG: hypothetical protein Q8K89_02920, partial [Actinomycetota bacterium]|nr:hypothetical protein [Actinomycetota bacterium]